MGSWRVIYILSKSDSVLRHSETKVPKLTYAWHLTHYTEFGPLIELEMNVPSVKMYSVNLSVKITTSFSHVRWKIVSISCVGKTPFMGTVLPIPEVSVRPLIILRERKNKTKTKQTKKTNKQNKKTKTKPRENPHHHFRPPRWLMVDP